MCATCCMTFVAERSAPSRSIARCPMPTSSKRSFTTLSAAFFSATNKTHRPSGKFLETLCFSLPRNKRLQLPSGGAEPVSGREPHPLKSSAFSRGTVIPTTFSVVALVEEKYHRTTFFSFVSCSGKGGNNDFSHPGRAENSQRASNR